MKYKKFQRNNQFVSELKHFFECVENQKQTINPIEDGLSTLKISLAVKKSSVLKKNITVKK